MARAVIEFKPSDLKRSYILPCDCPIFHALNRAGVPVLSVNPDGFTTYTPDLGGLQGNPFTKKLRDASDLLSRTIRASQRRKLLGQRFQVTW